MRKTLVIVSMFLLPTLANAVDVEIFVASSCSDCDKTLGFLDALEVNYESYNLEKDREAERDYRSSHGRGIIPLLRTDKHAIRGYSPRRIRELLKSAGIELGCPSTQVGNENKPAPEAKLPPANKPPNSGSFDVSPTLEQHEKDKVNQ